MIQATQQGKHCFLVRLDVPDAIAIQKIACVYGLKATDILVACINKGITCHNDMLSEIEAHDNKEH